MKTIETYNGGKVEVELDRNGNIILYLSGEGDVYKRSYVYLSTDNAEKLAEYLKAASIMGE